MWVLLRRTMLLLPKPLLWAYSAHSQRMAVGISNIQSQWTRYPSPPCTMALECRSSIDSIENTVTMNKINQNFAFFVTACTSCIGLMVCICINFCVCFFEKSPEINALCAKFLKMRSIAKSSKISIQNYTYSCILGPNPDLADR